MSVACTRWAWTVEGLAPSTRLVLLLLADFANDNANAWPTVATVARLTGLSRRTVFRALEELAGARLIVELGRGGKSGRQLIWRVCGKWIREQGFYVWRWSGDATTGEWWRVGLTLPQWSHSPKVSPWHPKGATMAPLGCHSDTQSDQ